MSAIGYTFLSLCFLLAIRNQLAYRWGIRAIEEAHSLAGRLIDEGREDFLSPYEKLPSHEKLMFDLTQWTYRSPFKEYQ